MQSERVEGAVDYVALAADMEESTPFEIIRWSIETFQNGLSLACSFQDCVIIDMACSIDPSVEVIFLDTGFHFPETLAFVEEIRLRYNLNIVITHPMGEAISWPCGTDRCCELRKVIPLKEALRSKKAWLTALKRSDSPTRSTAAIISFDRQFDLVKVNPFARWSDSDVNRYILEHELPVHPLIAQGYLSIGCAPTTGKVAPGDVSRSGRFLGMEKTECGIHIPSQEEPQ